MQVVNERGLSCSWTNLPGGWRKAKGRDISEMRKRAFSFLAVGNLINLKVSVWKSLSTNVALCFRIASHGSSAHFQVPPNPPSS